VAAERLVSVSRERDDLQVRSQLWNMLFVDVCRASDWQGLLSVLHV
jgi:hypothetical protein